MKNTIPLIDDLPEMPGIMHPMPQDLQSPYRLPKLLDEMLALVSSDIEKDMLLIGCLTTISACLPNLTGRYDGRTYGPNLFAFVTAPPATGKGCLMLARNLVEPVNDCLVARGDQPLIIPANSSSSAFLEMLYDNNGRGLMHETEADVMTYAIKMDMGNYSPALRAAFQHEALAFSRRRNNEKIAIAKPFLSVLLSGTPAQVQSLIPDTENGLFSRFLFWFTHSKLVWKDVFSPQGRLRAADPCSENNPSSLDDVARQIGSQVRDLFLFCEQHPMVFRLSPDQECRFNRFFETLQDDQARIYGEEIVPSIRRLGVSAFRIAMVLSALRLQESSLSSLSSTSTSTSSPSLSSTLTLTSSDFSFLLHMVGALVVHTDKIFLDTQELRLRRDRAEAEMQKPLTTSQASFYDHLPRHFFTRKAREVAAELHISKSNCFKYLKKFLYQHILKQPRYGEYEKQ